MPELAPWSGAAAAASSSSMSPTTSSLKTHADNGHTNRQGRAAFKAHHLPPPTRGLSTPTPVQMSETEAEDDTSSWYGSVLGELRGGKTEIDVIREWFVNIFQPLEKTADLVVTDFKFEPLSGSDASAAQAGRRNGRRNGSTGKNGQGNPGVYSKTRVVATTSEEEQSYGDEDTDAEDQFPPFRVLKQADVDLRVGGKPKTYSVVIKVLPTDDPERHTNRRKFRALLKFSKEVQVYQNVIHSMLIYDEKRYPSACVEPPVPKCYLSQLDAQNDVLVLENLTHSGYRKYEKAPHLVDVDHCRVVLRRLAHFHAISTLIQRDSEMYLVDLFPFAIDAVSFQQRYNKRVSKVKEELSKYLVHCTKWSPESGSKGASGGSPIEKHLNDLFWKLVELRTTPVDRRLSVLVHGALDPCNIVFQYDEASGRPICAKFLDFSALTVSSPVIDITYFLHRAVHPDVAAANHALFLQIYHRAHTEAIKSFGMHGFEMELETLLNEYQAKQDYGAMMACLLRPAIYVLQCMNTKDADARDARDERAQQQAQHAHKARKPKTPKRRPKGGSVDDDDDDVTTSTSNNDNNCCKDSSAATAEEGDAETPIDPLHVFPPTVPVERLRVDRDLVPCDLRLHMYLSALAKACPCPCAIGGSRELTISELSADSLEDLHIVARQQDKPGLKTFDCSNGGTTNTLKKLLFGFMSHKDDSSSGAASASSCSRNNNNGSGAANGAGTTISAPHQSKREHQAAGRA